MAVSAVNTGGRTLRLGARGRVSQGPAFTRQSLEHVVYRGARLATQSCTPAGKEGPPTEAPMFSSVTPCSGGLTVCPGAREASVRPRAVPWTAAAAWGRLVPVPGACLPGKRVLGGGGRSQEAHGPPCPRRLRSAGISRMSVLIPVVLRSQDSAVGPKAALRSEGVDTRLDPASPQALAAGPPHCLEEVSLPPPGAVAPEEGAKDRDWRLAALRAFGWESSDTTLGNRDLLELRNREDAERGGTRGVRLGERSPDRGAHTPDRAWSLGSWVKREDEVVMDALAFPAMAFCARILSLLSLTLSGTRSRKSWKTVPPKRPRVNGWSQPIHYLQVVAWMVFLIVTFTTFGIFIPFLPPGWRYIAYGVSSGISLFYVVVHLIAVSIDPAEANVRLKRSYSRSVPTFDRSKHAHVIQRQHCHLCQVIVTMKAKHCSTCNKCVLGFDHHCKWINNCVGKRNYWYFFTSVASASAGLLYMVSILLYVFIQYFIDPAGLRTDPHYTGISDQNTWLLFLPFFPVRTSTPVFLGIGVLVLLLELISLLLLGHLLFFHIYLRSRKLSTLDYIRQNYQQESSTPLAVKSDVTSQSKELSQQPDNHLRSAVQGRKKLKEFLPTSMHLRLCSTAVKPEDTSSSEQPVASLSSSLQRVKLTEQDSTISTLGESSSGLELDANLSSATVGVKWEVFLLPPSRWSGVTDLRTIGPESSLQPQDAKDQQEIRQHMEGDVAENQGSASGAQGPAPTESPFQGSFSASMPPVESVPESHSPLSSLHGHRKDTWSQRRWDVLPGSQEPWSLESTVLNISGRCQEVPRVWTKVPYMQMPQGLPVIKEEEYGRKALPANSVEEGCSTEEATEPGSSPRATVIVMPEDPELEDGAAPPL
ncbi:uncharacterized protein [Physeter macrocephalus]|uniref:Palmitoyltransferase n=1 Tax=Physeter macrocephalus TaxID=9755 RepID=A0A455BJU0_PHYMC|nr:uncharacterized protein LOC114486774 [Physeter catodon]|eukprot:XP_028349119.1 uncharacterized protein LOC114486774 [Physeter catodon]